MKLEGDHYLGANFIDLFVTFYLIECFRLPGKGSITSTLFILSKELEYFTTCVSLTHLVNTGQFTQLTFTCSKSTIEALEKV